MAEAYVEEIGLIDQQKGVSLPSSTGDPLVDDILESMDSMQTAKENYLAAEAELNRLMTEKIDGEEDPFVAMMNAMLYVVPQLMKCKEEKLVEKTASFEYVNSLNAYMADTQKEFAHSADKTDPTKEGNSYKSGDATGLANGEAYKSNLETSQSQNLFDALPAEVAKCDEWSCHYYAGIKDLYAECR